jgi:hypothetical protein
MYITGLRTPAELIGQDASSEVFDIFTVAVETALNTMHVHLQRCGEARVPKYNSVFAATTQRPSHSYTSGRCVVRYLK